jgi:DNA repair exonuclease SbcCD nuclease subunit
MNIQFISDLHLDISGQLDLPGGEVLVVAGDACEARTLINEFKIVETSANTKSNLPCYDFFKIQCAKYKRVFYVMGNHEHYHGKLWKTKSDLKKVLPTNVYLLENNFEEYQGVIFVGATLWTDMNKGDPLTLASMKDYMNDYRVITYFHPQHNTYRKMHPEDTVRMHQESKKYLEAVLNEHSNKSVVVITHMGPTHLSIDEKFKHQHISNGAYVSDLSNFILDRPNIKYWIHGHVHNPTDYQIGETRVVCNPRGYLPYEGNNGFHVGKSIEL